METKGRCVYCDEMQDSKKLKAHLKTHFKAIVKERLASKKAFHLFISSEGYYFLHLLVNEDVKLYDLDDFFKDIWLECCGHLSLFELKRSRRGVNKDGWVLPEKFEEEFGIKMKTKVGKLFAKGRQFTYQYDFGTTTELDISIVDEYFIDVPDGIILLNRNEPLPFMCSKCKKKPATIICPIWHGDGSEFCDTCKLLHQEECEDYEVDDYEFTMVNSPRVGVCGYEGGVIDTERDGVWQKGT